MPKKSKYHAVIAVSKQRLMQGESVIYEQKAQNTRTLTKAINDSEGV